MTSETILGLDISTSCTGICILSKQGDVLAITSVDLSKVKTFIEKCELMTARLSELSKLYRVSNVYIEQNMSAFRPGMSSAHTINALARFNGAVNLIAYQVFGVAPVLLNVINARNHVGLKINHKDKTSSTKEKIYAWVTQMISVEWPLKKSGAPRPECFDMADAYVVARAGWAGCKE
jgi:Holliday junction resolvasome RuvABC endonuclease subunit